jgi:hypothetical protein
MRQWRLSVAGPDNDFTAYLYLAISFFDFVERRKDTALTT